MWSRLELLLGNRRDLVAALVASSVLSGFTEAAILAVVAQAATSIVNHVTRIHVHMGLVEAHVSVDTLLLIGLVLAVIRLALQVMISYLPARIAADVQTRLRGRIFKAFTRASWDVQSEDREGHLQETMTSQVLQATQGALWATALVTSLFTFVVLVISALALNVIVAMIVLVAAVCLFLLLRPLNSLGGGFARSLSVAQMAYASGIGEAIRVAEETHAFGVENAQRERIDGLVETAHGLFFRTQFIGRFVPALYQSLIFLVLVGGLIAVSALGSGHVASLGAVVLLLVRAGTYGQQLQGSYQLVRQAGPFIERLYDVQRRYETSQRTDGGIALRTVETLAFDGVSFYYRPERPVLADISFETSKGETIGVVGPSGAGKSTLVQLLLQLRAPAIGRYLVNGEPAEHFTTADWRRLVSYVPQEPRLVHASVADNIRFYRALDHDAIERAARLARIHDDIVGWSKGYDTIVGPRADAVSGGQQQRICLARALAAHPEVLVLDEPTSALDPRSEALIQESLAALKGDLTLFIIAHRMSTLNICDRVMVVLDGQLDAFDTIASLQAHNTYYRSTAPAATASVSVQPT